MLLAAGQIGLSFASLLHGQVNALDLMKHRVMGKQFSKLDLRGIFRKSNFGCTLQKTNCA